MEAIRNTKEQRRRQSFSACEADHISAPARSIMVNAWCKRRPTRVSVMFWVLTTIISIATFAAVIFAVYLMERVVLPEPARRERSDTRRDVRPR
jgi:hypothetical protein